MKAPRVLEDQVSIVLIGQFNPAIFQPAWLAAKGLIRESEASSATIEVIHPEIAQFRAGWLHLSVTANRFVASTSDPACAVPLRDLVVGIFGLLAHTPTQRMGLNRAMHFDLVDDAHWHALGHLLAPKAPWHAGLASPGMRSLVMEGARNDALPGRRFFRVEPSLRFPHAALIDINNDYELPATTKPLEATAYFTDHIRDDWTNTMLAAMADAGALLAAVPEEP